MQHASDIRACLTAHQRGGNECFDLLTHCSLQSLLTKGGGGCEWEWGSGTLCFLSAVKVLSVMENWAGRAKRMRKSSFEGFSKCDFYGYCCLVAKSCPTLLWPHGLYPASLLCLWDFPGKKTGGGCHFLLQRIFPTQGSNPSRRIVGRCFTVWATREALNLAWKVAKTGTLINENDSYLLYFKVNIYFNTF